MALWVVAASSRAYRQLQCSMSHFPVVSSLLHRRPLSTEAVMSVSMLRKKSIHQARQPLITFMTSSQREKLAPFDIRTRNLGFSATMPLMEKIVVKVPTMGDSITEGTIVEWTAEVGQAVKADDVVALIETDKVTIEIKADVSGVISQHFGSINETVEVGASLYEIDTEGSATVAASSAATASTVVPPVEKESVIKSTSEHLRAPSIKFLGKDGWEALRKGHGKPIPKESSTGAKPKNPHGVSLIVDDSIGKNPMYGRPKFTEAEIEALMTGGATMAPQVLSHSTGAKFKL